MKLYYNEDMEVREIVLETTRHELAIGKKKGGKFFFELYVYNPIYIEFEGEEPQLLDSYYAKEAEMTRCVMCGCVTEESMCPDCGISDPSVERVISANKIYATQGGGFVAWDDELGYTFVQAPPGYEVGDEMPERWGLAPTVTSRPLMDCFICGSRYIETKERYDAWGNSGYSFDPTDWECPSCRAMVDEIEEYYDNA